MCTYLPYLRVVNETLNYTTLSDIQLASLFCQIRPNVADWEVILRLCLAVVVGSVVGFEREYTAHAAGLRTHILVALGAALFTLAGVVVEGADPTRVAGLAVGLGAYVETVSNAPLASCIARDCHSHYDFQKLTQCVACCSRSLQEHNVSTALHCTASVNNLAYDCGRLHDRRLTATVM
eukprot:16738-Heterococcus_DN1.PRE.1